MRKPADYKEAVAYIEELPKFTKKHTLEHTRDFLRRLGDPALDRRIIHVAGTNGKGSVCAYIQAILETEGKKTGFFTSPHLVSVNERIQIGRCPIDDDTFYQVFSEVYDTVMQMEEEGVSHPSYFEFLFGMGMKAFSLTDAEYLVLETGLGGRLDATNACPKPALTVITSISLDHTDILGDTIEAIAAEKAGILKPEVPVIFDGSSPEASAVIRKKAESLGIPCREISNHAYEIREVNRKYIAFSRTVAYDKDITWKVPICGLYQVMNAEIAIEAAEYLLQGEEIHRSLWAEAVASITWKGRMEEVGDHLVIDGAHNPGAIQAFAESVNMLEKDGRALPVLVFSAVSDKKYEQMIAYLCSHLPVKAYVVTEIADDRGVPAEELGDLFRKYTTRKVIVEKDISAALSAASREREAEGMIYCVGSLYLAGMIENLLSGGDGDAEL